MAFPGFHTVVQQWFTTEVGQPTEAQLRAWEAIAAGRHALVAAPTGSGKTLAAFLSAINGLLEESQSAPTPGRGPRRLRVAAESAECRHPRAAIGRLAGFTRELAPLDSRLAGDVARALRAQRSPALA